LWLTPGWPNVLLLCQPHHLGIMHALCLRLVNAVQCVQLCHHVNRAPLQVASPIIFAGAMFFLLKSILSQMDPYKEAKDLVSFCMTYRSASSMEHGLLLAGEEAPERVMAATRTHVDAKRVRAGKRPLVCPLSQSHTADDRCCDRC
jgi:hypothetical protein